VPGRVGQVIATSPPPAAGLDLAVDLHVATTLSYGRATLAAAVARAVATGLRELGVADHVGPDAGWLDGYVATVRATAAVAPVRVHCGLEIGLLDAAGALDLPDGTRPQLSRVDYVVLVPAGPTIVRRPGTRPTAEQVIEDVLLAALRAAATVPVPTLLAGLFAVLPTFGLDERDVPDQAVRDLGWACARAGVAVEVGERWRAPSPRVARLLAGAGVTLAAGSAARSVAEIGRWEHVRDVAAALAAAPVGVRP
jgi:histidinol phosphatase-like PHP family hydrolase